MKEKKSVGGFRGILVVVLMAFALTVAGCATHYYKVSDPASGKTYYTKKVKKAKIGGKRTGGIIFEDATTKSEVTLQSSEVLKISGKEFKAATKK